MQTTENNIEKHMQGRPPKGPTVWWRTIWVQVPEAEMPWDGNIRVVALAIVAVEVAGNNTRITIST